MTDLNVDENCEIVGLTKEEVKALLATGFTLDELRLMRFVNWHEFDRTLDRMIDTVDEAIKIIEDGMAAIRKTEATRNQRPIGA